MPINGELDKENVVQINDGLPYSHKNNKIISFTAMWMQLEAITLSKLMQKQKNKYFVFSHIDIVGVKVWALMDIKVATIDSEYYWKWERRREARFGKLPIVY